MNQTVHDRVPCMQLYRKLLAALLQSSALVTAICGVESSQYSNFLKTSSGPLGSLACLGGSSEPPLSTGLPLYMQEISYLKRYFSSYSKDQAETKNDNSHVPHDLYIIKMGCLLCSKVDSLVAAGVVLRFLISSSVT